MPLTTALSHYRYRLKRMRRTPPESALTQQFSATRRHTVLSKVAPYLPL
jgi:hypothetical protein